MDPAHRIEVGDTGQVGRPLHRSGFSITGSRHLSNGDRYAVSGRLAVVTDGVSGSRLGADAAQACVDMIRNGWSDSQGDCTAGNLLYLLQTINGGLLARAMSLPSNERHRGGCCIAGVAFGAGEQHALLFHAGDVSVHRLTTGVLERLTQDHVPASGSRRRGRVRSALGVVAAPEISISEIAVRSDDIFVIASDGCELDKHVWPDLPGNVTDLSNILHDRIAVFEPEDDATALVLCAT